MTKHTNVHTSTWAHIHKQEVTSDGGQLAVAGDTSTELMAGGFAHWWESAQFVFCCVRSSLSKLPAIVKLFPVILWDNNQRTSVHYSIWLQPPEPAPWYSHRVPWLSERCRWPLGSACLKSWLRFYWALVIKPTRPCDRYNCRYPLGYFSCCQAHVTSEGNASLSGVMHTS